MPASGRLKAASGDYSRVCKQTVPAALAFSPPAALSPSEPSRDPPCGVKNKAHVAGTYLFLYRQRRHHQSALSFDAEKEGAGCGVSATGWRIGLILRAPCSAADRTLPRKTTCGGFWYFWPQKYKKETLFSFAAFRWRKAAKATRPIPMSASERLKAASGDCAGLQANRPRRSRFQPSVRFLAIETQSGPAMREKKR